MEAPRFPVSVRFLGVMQKEKKKMYMASVLWSDQNDVVIYRRFQEFKKMHKQMKKAFPPANPLKKSSRIIPKFRARKMKQNAAKSGPSKSVDHLKFLEKYCNDLLSCDLRVSQSPELVHFFHPKDQDLQADFVKNSVMIMPSDDALRGQTQRGSVGNVTQPFITATYRCLAPYETKDTKNRPFKVALDEKVDVLIKDKAGWWLVENEDKRLAWFPAPYLVKADDEEDDDEDEIDGADVLYTAAKAYKATKVDEVSLQIGSVVEVLQKSENGWWLIRSAGKVGYVPTMYLQPYNNPRIRMAALKNDLRGSVLNLANPSTGLPGPAHDLSRSQGNLLQMPATRFPLPSPLRSADKLKSHSLDILSEAPSSVISGTKPSSATATASPAPVPSAMVEMHADEERRERALTRGSEESLGSDSSDFSLSDDLSSTSGSPTINLSCSPMDQRLRTSSAPPPMVEDRRSPTPDSSAADRRMSSPTNANLTQRPVNPKVPPRPRAQEILTRCTTITRKNVAKAWHSPGPAEILSR